jgi:AcrR family transcriptional regulator
MLATTLQKLVEEGKTTVPELAELAGVSPSTVYRWLGRRSQPDFDSIRLLVRHLPDPMTQQSILALLTTGTSWRLTRHDVDLDINHDGRIDAEDALDAAIQTVYDAGEALTNVRQASSDGTISREEAFTLVRVLDEVIGHSVLVQNIMTSLVRDGRRRKLRLSPSPNAATGS